MGKKYTNPQAADYLLEAEACELVCKELRRVAEKYQRAVDKEATKRQSEFETAMEYTSELQIQDAYGWGYITEAQYERYIDLFRNGQAALENMAPTPKALARNILYRIIGSVEAECQEWKFSALSPKEQIAERERREHADLEWKKKIEEIKKRRGIIAAPEETEDTTC